MSREHLSLALRRIAASGTTAMTDRATALREAGRDVISLSVGEPDFDTPPHVLGAAQVALNTGQTKYTPVTGTLRLKQAAALHFRRDLGIAQARGAREAIFVRDDGLVTEGSYTNVFVERDGVLLTPPASLGLLPGILRAELLDEGRAAEAELTLADLASGFFIGNALRGLLPARITP